MVLIAPSLVESMLQENRGQLNIFIAPLITLKLAVNMCVPNLKVGFDLYLKI